MSTLNFVLIRHGSTAGNLRGAYIGSTDEPLSPTGREELIRNRRAGCYPPVNRAFCSPLLRCRQTAEILYSDIAATQIDSLRERDFGLFEGLTHAEIIRKPGFSAWGTTEESMVFPLGESDETFRSRCRKGLQDMVSASCADKTVAVICHGGVIMELLAAMEAAGSGRFSRQCAPGTGFLVQYDLAAGIAHDVREVGR